ncbi:MAG: hypothetical protein RLZZ205_443 [Bacteroidota bacterium]|jgi:uncharacterized protein (DUF779 family)
MTDRISATEQAIALMHALQSKYGELIFHQSGGCCDGSAPMCYPKNEFIIGFNDVCLGHINGAAFWMSQDQFEYWQHTHLTIDVVEGRGSSFSLEIPLGKRFIVRSRLFTESELKQLTPTTKRED